MNNSSPVQYQRGILITANGNCFCEEDEIRELLATIRFSARNILFSNLEENRLLDRLEYRWEDVITKDFYLHAFYTECPAVGYPCLKDVF
jgi:hypothetical protein